MRVMIAGLGYVGSVTAACLLADGHQVIGADADPLIANAYAHGTTSINEPGVAEMLAEGHRAGRLAVSRDLHEIANADIVMVCVGTQARADNSLDLSDLETVTTSIGAAVRKRPSHTAPLLVVIRSTILPGTMASRLAPLLESKAGEAPGHRYRLVYNPEFMREGSAVTDFRAPSRIVVGGTPGTAATLLELYRDIPAPRFETTFEVAEAIKFADNSFHALKVAFANEIGRFAISHGVSPASLMELFVADTKLNISDQYLRPGLGYGGPCLPKDLGALVLDMEQSGLAVPVLANVAASNRRQEDFLVDLIMSKVARGSRILLVGLTFKQHSGDLRGSPLVSLAMRLVEQGFNLSIHDPDLNDASHVEVGLRERLIGALPTATGWDLVVFGKPLPSSRATIGPHVQSIDLERL